MQVIQLTHISDGSLNEYASIVTALASGDSQTDHPLRLETKFFVEHSQIMRVLSKIHAHELVSSLYPTHHLVPSVLMDFLQLGYRFVDILRKRVNKNDGLIFVAEADSFRPQRTVEHSAVVGCLP